MADYEGINEFKEWIKSVPVERMELIIELTDIHNTLDSLYLQNVLDNISKGKNMVSMKELRIARLLMDCLVMLHKIKNKPKRRKFTYEDIRNALWK